MQSVKNKLLIICGPTSSGKKRLSLMAAERLNGEIISADSRKVYRGLDIGTAKTPPEDRARIPHHLIDIIEPDEPFSAGDWVLRAREAVRDIIDRGRLPIISGGTGFYIRAFREGLTRGIDPDPGLREKLEEELDDQGGEAMYEMLQSCDPDRAAELHVNDTFRVLRALEAFYTTGKTHEARKSDAKITGGDYDCFSVGMAMPRETLYDRIDDRMDDMVERGLTDEVKHLLDHGYDRNSVALDTVGYKEWFPWIDGEIEFNEALEAVKRNTRRYAKRQLTWFRRQHDLRWVDILEPSAVDKFFRDVKLWLADK